MAAQISVPVSNVADFIALGHTKIEIWWSGDEGRHYREVTASTPKPAILISQPASTTFQLGGRTLTISINGGSPIAVVFPQIIALWTPEMVAQEINNIIPGLATVRGLSVVLTSPTSGRTSSLEIVETTAGDILFPMTNTYGDLVGVSAATSRGQDARPTLVTQTLVYQYLDSAGSVNDRYMWRFSADSLQPISEFSDRVLGSVPIIGTVSLCTAQFIGLDGRPQKRSVVFVSDSLQSSNGKVIGNRDQLIVESDDRGFLQAPLVVGTRLRVAVDGTAFVREITVPSSPSFDLLQAMATAPDPFTIQVPLPFLVRRHI